MTASTLVSARARPGGTLALLAPFAGFAAVALVVGDEGVELAMAVIVLVALLWHVGRAPLGVGVLIVTFVALALDTPDQRFAGGEWRSPLYVLGTVMLAHLNVATGIKALFFSGMDLMIACLFAVAVWRTPAARADGDGRPARAPIRVFAWLSLLGTLAWWLYGLSEDGNFTASLWQANKLYYVPLLVILFDIVFRYSPDYRPLGRVLIVAACLRAGLAMWIAVAAMNGDGPDYATTHADSILFACAISLIVALAVEEPRRRRRTLYLLALPVILGGMVANNRRLVWVAVAWAVVTYYLVTPWTARKRALTRAALLSLPLIAVYLAIGWRASSIVFAPARLVASVVSSDVDGSTRWRDLENFNLVYTVVQNPVLGTGFGHEYVERVRLPDVSEAFPMYRYQPHNGMLGLWAFGGLAGFTAHWLLLVAGIFYAARAYRHAARAIDRAAALSCIAAIVIYMISAYGDTTLGSWPGVFTVAPAIALSGNLAITTGAWRPAVARAAGLASARPSLVAPPGTTS